MTQVFQRHYQLFCSGNSRFNAKLQALLILPSFGREIIYSEPWLIGNAPASNKLPDPQASGFKDKDPSTLTPSEILATCIPPPPVSTKKTASDSTDASAPLIDLRPFLFALKPHPFRRPHPRVSKANPNPTSPLAELDHEQLFRSQFRSNAKHLL